ncbi:MAG: peptidoglycan DD-metalloendopeptidase family protein [Saprospiraceae bacterium]|nr:peptidoglycan DD-metalloendopeptidase family protein [Saprospiraceae bacterium]
MDKQKTSRPSRRTKIISSGMVLAAFSMIFFVPALDQWDLGSAAEISSFEIQEPTTQYGFVLDTFLVEEGIIQNGDFLSDVMVRHNIDYQIIDKLAKGTKDVFDVRNIREGKKYVVLKDLITNEPEFFIYEPSVYGYVIYSLNEEPTAEYTERSMTTKVETAAGIIEDNLWNAIVGNGHSYDLASRMEDVLAWSIDFHHILKGDRFKLIYEQQYIGGQKVGVGGVIGAYYKNGDKEYHAIRFGNEIHDGYYDLDANSMEKAFLKSPVKYSRITSRYSRSRFHPVLRRRKAHLGTDYAAPMGTPIYAVADGLVTKASRSRGNGNYVKIKHDNTYTTQYLHMSRFAKGMKSGTHVKQGEVIGYVGKTGYATGPHVCFRFWKNGKQVNHLKENLPPPEPMPEEDIPAFMVIRDKVKNQLDGVPWPRKQSQQEVGVAAP